MGDGKMAGNPLASIIIPCRDGEKTIVETLDSLLCQTAPISITIIDDHSIDTTPDILEKYARKGVKSIRYPQREERSYSRVGKIINYSLDTLPTTPFYMISGDDTKYPPEYVEKIISYMKEEKSSIASGHIKKHNKTNKPCGTGRIFTQEQWKKLTPFLDNIAWETACLYETLKENKTLSVYPIKIEHLKPHSNESIETFGHGAYILGVPLKWTLLRAIKDFFIGNLTLTQSISLIKGHYEYHRKKMQKLPISSFVNEHHEKRLKKIFFPWRQPQ